EKALNLYQQLYSASNPRIAQANINIGFIYAELEFYGDAIINFEEALEIWKSIYPEPHPNKAIALSYLGRTYNRMGDSEAALAYFEQAKEIYQQSYGNKHPDLAQLHNQIAIIHINNSDYQQALDHLQQAIIANVVDFNERNPELNPAINQFYNGTALLYSLHSKAKAYEARHYFKSLKFKDREKALGSLQACDTLIEQLRRQSSNESDKLAVSAIATEVYEDGVRLSKNMSEITWKTKIFRELSFYFSEKSKSAVLLDAISDSEAKSFANIPDALLEEEKALKATIAFCAQKLAEKPGEDEERALREAYFDLNRDYEAFVKRLEIEYPEYFNLKFNSTAPDVASVQQKLKPNQALISYFIAEREQRLYIYLITHKSFKIESKAIDKNFERYLTGFRNSIYFQDNDTYFLTAHDLYKQLMPSKIPGYVKDLVIIPVGRMGTIPFEALLTKRIKQTDVNFEDLSYLVNDYSITYEFATSLILQENKTKDIANNNILLCAPVKFTSNRLLPELPASETEVNKIEELFNANQYQSTSLTFEDACEDKLKSKDLKQYRLLHFATHGIVDEVHPELSRIFLNAAAGSGEDGNLFSGEIYNLEMDADLVVLSACQTGLGKVSKGEGVIGLSRALVYAGARKLIVSYWSVADNSTAVLMMNFYRNLINQNELKESAAPLRMAKLDMIKAKEFADPYYWAPFILIGY
ncbi:MAG TPA: CHAT domain-containing protein, partial [Cyclobacteriaceae bacterium]|nr:CHAT domain-containing protein [Cyclobacteriaceae bacterium]